MKIDYSFVTFLFIKKKMALQNFEQLILVEKSKWITNNMISVENLTNT